MPQSPEANIRESFTQDDVVRSFIDAMTANPSAYEEADIYYRSDMLSIDQKIERLDAISSQAYEKQMRAMDKAASSKTHIELTEWGKKVAAVALVGAAELVMLRFGVIRWRRRD